LVFNPIQQNNQLSALQTENVVFDSSSHHFQQQSKKYKRPFIDLNLQASESSTPPVYSDEYFSLDNNEVGTSTSNIENSKILVFDLNKSPPKH